jgi:hypothetical protein
MNHLIFNLSPKKLATDTSVTCWRFKRALQLEESIGTPISVYFCYALVDEITLLDDFLYAVRHYESESVFVAAYRRDLIKSLSNN